MVRRSLHLTVRLAGWLLGSLVVLSALAVWLLSAGPLPLDALKPYLERALSTEQGDITTTIERTELRIGQRQGVALVALGVAARDAAGEVLLELPEVELALSPGALLRHQILAPARLRARAPKVVLVRRADGTIGFRGGAGTRQDEGQKLFDLKLLAGAVLAEPDPALPLSFLELVGVEGASVTLEDARTGTRIEASNGTLSVVREAGVLAARAAIRIDRGGRPLGLTALVRLDPERDAVDAALDLQDARPVDLRLIQDLLPEPAIEALGPIPLETIDVALRGRLRAEADLAGGDLLGASFRLASPGGRIVWPEQLDGPLELARLDLAGGYDPASGSTTIERLDLIANGASIDASGSVRLTRDGPAIRAAAAFRNVQIDQLRALWPRRAADEARAWVVENILAGSAPEGTIAIDLQPGDLDQRPLRKAAVTGTFAYQDLTIRYFEPLPAVTGVDGTAAFDAQTMTFEAAGGRLGELRADSAAISVTGIGIKGRDTTQLEVDARIDGPVRDALRLLDLPPFGFASELGIDPEAARGEARTRLRVGLPLHREMDDDEVRLAAEATLSDVAVDGLYGVADLRDGALDLEVDRQAMALRGRATFAGVPLRIDWDEAFTGRPYDRRFELEGLVDVEALRGLGVEDLPVEVAGAARTHVNVVEQDGHLSVVAALDLETARLAYPPLDWRKPLGDPARLEARLEIEGGELALERLVVESAGLRAAGEAQLSLAPLELRRLEIARFEQGEQRLAGQVVRSPGGALEIALRARRLDLRPLIAAARDRPEADRAAVPRLRLELSAREVLLDEDNRLRDLEGSLARDDRGWRTADLEALLAGGQLVRLRLRPEDGVRRLILVSDDTGGLLQALDRTRQVEGGRLRLEADLEAQEPALRANGRLLVDDFTLRGAPVLARLLTVGSLTGIGNLLQGEGIFVDRLELPFQLERDVITLADGRLSGSQLGLTVEGTIDLDAERLDLDGTVVPVYGLNRAIGSIPVIGDFLSGSEGEGAFAATYRVTGPIDDPSVSVNPLSALTPGFLRELVTGIREGTLEPPELLEQRD